MSGGAIDAPGAVIVGRAVALSCRSSGLVGRYSGVSKNPLRGVADSGKTLDDRLRAGITTWPEGLVEETTLTIKSFGLALGLAIVCMPLAAAAQSGGSDDIDLASAAQLFKNNCSACHGKKAQGVASYPKLAGQDAAYLAGKLQTYRAGEMVGPNSVLMIQNAKDLSDQDIASLAAYISTTFEE